MGFDDEDDKVIEPEGMFSEGEKVFTHQGLVMIALKKCIEFGSKELREGWWETKVDKNGNTSRKYNSDTRKEFINSVKSLMMMTECDYDDELKIILKNLLDKLEERKNFWMEQEWNWWCGLSKEYQKKLISEGKGVNQGMFNSSLYFDNLYFEEETEVYRRICTEINNMIKRRDFYESEEYEA